MGAHVRRPNRMARLRITIYLVLVLAAHINVGNPMMQERRPEGHQEERSEQSVSRPEVHNRAGLSHREVHSTVMVSQREVHSKARVSRPEIHSKVSVSRPEIHSKVPVSRPEVHSKVPVSRPEVHRKVPVSRPEVHSKAGVSRPEVHSKAGVSGPEVHSKVPVSRSEVHSKARVSRPEMHRKAEVSRLNIYEKLFRLDSHSNQLEQSGDVLKVKDCPVGCYCELKHRGDQTALLVENCESDPFDALPKLFDSHRNITLLGLINCHLTRLPPEIMKLTLVIFVDLDGNEFTELPQELLGLPQLVELYMRNNKLSCLPADVTPWLALTWLELGHNMITELPKEMGGMRNLQLLNLTYNNLQTLPHSIGELSKLRGTLDISHNDLLSLPHSIGTLSQLQGLWIDHNNLQTLPDSIGTLSQLQYLYIEHNNLQTLPDSIGTLSQLQFLSIDHNNLQTLPDSIGTLSQLQYLYIHHNNLQSLPHSIGTLSQLRGLSIEHNNLQSLPDSIGTLSQLQFLSIDHNNLQTLPDSIGTLSQLQFLSIHYNNLLSLPHGIGALSQLVQLTINHNKLRSLPAEVGNLTQLHLLRLYNNQLKTLPCEIGGMTKLQQLELQYNEITTLPNQITELKHLAGLDLSNNPLGEVPALPTERLIQFACTNCSIQTFPCELFTEAPMVVLELSYNSIKTADCGKIQNFHVEKLDLSHNLLQEVPCEDNFFNIQAIDFSYNNISTLPNMCKLSGGQYMQEIYFDNNKIDVLHFSSFCTDQSSRTLRYVGFSYNSISAIDTSDSPLHQCFSPALVIQLQGNMLSTLDSWPMLLSSDISITLNVSDNKLSKFTSSSGTFLHASHYGSVFTMQGNQIKHFMDVFNGWKVPVNTTKDLNTLLRNAYFDLGRNPLVCDCVDYEVYRYIQASTPEQYNNLMCHEPLSLRGQNPHHIPLWNFACDVPVNCPDGCTCIKVPHSQTINVTCLNYNQTDIPEVVPDLPQQNYKYRIDICHQNLLEINSRPFLQKATEILLSNNSIIEINSSTAFLSVKILHLDNNCLQRLPECVVGMTNDTAVEVRLGSNPWVCDCEVMAMKNWIMRNWHIVKDKDTILCHSPLNMVGAKVTDIERSKVCHNENVIYIVVAISSVVLIFIVYLYRHDKLKNSKLIKYFNFIVKDECDGENKEFDIFMCACSDEADSEYVENYLIPELERRDFRVLYHREHFQPGKTIHENMTEALQKSKRTLVFFSNSFKQSGHSMFEFHNAHDLDLRSNTRRLITIKDRDLDMRKLDASEVEYFLTHTYLDRDDAQFWELLESVLPKNHLGAQVRH